MKEEFISTRDTLYISKGVNVSNVETYSLGKPISKEKLNLFKKTFDPMSMEAKEIEKLIDKYSFGELGNIDVIITPKSNSPLLSFFVNALAKKLKAKVIEDVFVKTMPTDILIRTGPNIILNFETMKNLVKILENAKTKNSFEMKKVPPQFRKFFIQHLKSTEDLNKFKGKKILVVDDILTSGITVSEMYRQLMIAQVSSIKGLTIFKLR